MLQQQIIMLQNKSQIIILLLLCFVSFQAYIDILTPQISHISQNQEHVSQGQMVRNRILQATYSNDKAATTALKKMISDSNASRKSKGISTLTENANMNKIISQWSQVMRNNLQLTQYFQIYGIRNTQIQSYASIPLQNIVQVIQNVSLSLYDGENNQIGIFSNQITKNNYQVILVFQGGLYSQTITYNQELIQNTIKKLNQSNKINSYTQTQPTTTTNNQVSNQINPNKSASNTSSNDSNLNKSTENSNNNNSIKSTTQNISNTLNISITKQEVKNTTVVTNQSQSIQTNITQPTIKQTYTQTSPKTSAPQNSTNQTNLTTPTNNSSNQTAASVTVVPTTITNKSTYQTKTAEVSPITNQAQNNQTKDSNLLQKYPTKPQRIPQIKQKINNTDVFANIKLHHNIPTTFLKNQLFPFKGSITLPNPNGIQVNIIFTRISDQQRLPFSQYLRANQTQFYILTNLNITGDYYLSIFVGGSGLTSLTQYTIAPSSIGPFLSKIPTPINNAALKLIGNKLQLNWESADTNQPAITQIIFTQQNGQSIQFLISNYQQKFKIPFKLFYAFNQGPTNIQISQAFSSDQSASSRISPFSAPFNIVFNATTHHYDVVGSSNAFKPIPFKFSKGDNVVISGPAGVQLQNQVYLVTPSKSFDSYFITGNQSDKYVEKGTIVNLTLNLNESGVYILQINNSGGQALINIPLYVGDIYPLLPDFMDLSPTYIDLAALNQPQLLNDRRSLVLQLINNIRNAYGASNIYLDNNLNNLAQNYSLNQIQGNYVGHIDRQGRTPSQRAKAARIFQGVGQNIAVNNNLTNAQLMLQRSPAHLKNMVNPSWTRVGLGILQNSNQFYYLTQQFSSRDFSLYPLTNAQISSIQDTVTGYITNKYPHIVGQDKVLSSKLLIYQQMDNRPYIISYLQGEGYRNLAVANLQVSYNNGNYMDLIKSGSSFEPTSTAFKQVGISVIYTNGMLQIFVAYT